MTDTLPSIASFDAERRDAAIPVHAVSKAEAGAWQERSGAVRLARFEGAVGQVATLEDKVLVGTGEGEEPFALGAAASQLPAGDYRLEGEASALALLGWALGAYRFSRYKDQPAPPVLVLARADDEARLVRDARAATLVRDMVNTPAEEMGPAEIEGEVRRVAERYGASVAVTSGEALRTGFPLIHAVGRAAAQEPRLIDLRWGKEGPAVTLVGKGVCFDSGGLNIKNGKGMGLMKKDMGGAANALGLAMTIMAAKLPVRLRLLIPAVENAIAGNAFRPSDVFKARDGQTVEISNTDAEGRLILADALSLAAEEAPDRIVSLATLTGAARVALGPDLPPVYSTDPEFSEALRAAGDDAADPVWPMPLWQRYHDFLSSPIADVNHAASTPCAGSITAALFLSRFVDDVPYTHLDIYAWVPSARPGRPAGGEAQGIRALFSRIEKLA